MRPATLTFGLCLPVELSRYCANACEYCPYAYCSRKPLLPKKELRKEIHRARTLGATMVDLVSGEGLERVPAIRSSLRYMQMASVVDYFAAAGDLVRGTSDDTPLQARLNVGPLEVEAWPLVQGHIAGIRLLLTSVDPVVLEYGALRDSPSHNQYLRLQAIIDAGKAGLPVTSGTMLGIGESDAAREKAIKVLAKVAATYGHVHTLALQAFRPHPATPMANRPPTPLKVMLETVAFARHSLPAPTRVQINALDWPGKVVELVEAGATDLGDINLNVIEKRGNVAMELSLLFAPLVEKGYTLEARGCVPPGHLKPASATARPTRTEGRPVKADGQTARTDARPTKPSARGAATRVP